jgi:cell division protease FtsH
MPAKSIDTQEAPTASTRKQPEAPARPPWRIEGLPEAGGTPEQAGWRSRVPKNRWFWLFVLGLLLGNWLMASWMLGPAPQLEISYTDFIAELEAGNVTEVAAVGPTIEGTFKEPVVDEAHGSLEWEAFTTERPEFADDDLFQSLVEHGVEVSAVSPNQPTPFWQQLLLGFGPTALFLILMISFYRRAGQGMGAMGGLGRSRAVPVDVADKRATFDDVAGIDEAEEELAEVVDFLRNPDKYTALGAQIPRGVLLSGPPGTGKTLLARAVAGEANVPFFSMAASEFVEMIVGVGASRVRDLFAQAKKAAPSIIFIDEIDGIGRARGGAMSYGGHDEREQTLNQILTEMDGFTGREGVIVMAATNRPDVLDPALLRPGRFDRRVSVGAPDRNGRAAILRVHTRNVTLEPGVNLDDIAAMTPGMVGADLHNLVNEAALMAVRRGHQAVQLGDFTDALEKIVLGARRKIMMSEDDRKRTAYHESGHALLGILLPGADPVRKVSIIPRGRALGVTFQSPATDVYSYSEAYLLGRIAGALGGRAAEDLIYGEHTTGAESDIAQATQIARGMVGRWGMSAAIGPVAVLPGEDEMANPFAQSPVSAEAQSLVDSEVRRILDEQYALAYGTLRDNRDKLDTLAAWLLEKETLEEDEVYALVR